MKKFLILVLCSLFLCGCGNSKSLMEMISTDKKIALVAEPVGIDDNSVNELCYEGITKAKEELEIDVIVEKSDDRGVYEKKLRNSAREGYFTISVGADMRDEMESVAMDMKSNSFTIIGDEINLDNVKSISFKNEEGSYLMGVLAAKCTQNGKIGYIGNKRNEKNQAIETGFALGIYNLNPAAAENIINEQYIRYTNNNNNIDIGYEKAIELINCGCDIIFTDTGKSDHGVLKAAKEHNVRIIGAETDYIKEFPEYEPIIIGSMIKNVDYAIYSTCKEIKEGTFKSGLSNKVELDLKSGLIDFSINKKIYNYEEINEILIKYKDKIMSKQIEIPKRLISIKNI